jgi:hypothetical protein
MFVRHARGARKPLLQIDTGSGVGESRKQKTNMIMNTAEDNRQQTTDNR